MAGDPTGTQLDERAPEGERRLLHPLSGAIVLGLDWLLFSSSALSGFTLTWLLSIVGFVTAGVGVALAQRRLAGEAARSAWLKGLLAGIAVGVPFPVGGTALGGMVLAISGLDRWRKWLKLRR